MEWGLEQRITSHDALGTAFGDMIFPRRKRKESQTKCTVIVNF